MFAGKLHALLCRAYEKGRDWYDFIWFISNKTSINFKLLASAIDQQGPWAGKSISVNKQWCIDNLKEKIHQINWENLVSDVKPLLKAHEQSSLKVWTESFFLGLLGQL